MTRREFVIKYRQGLIRIAALLVGYGLFVIISASWGWPYRDTDPARWIAGIVVGVAAGLSIRYLGKRHIPSASLPAMPASPRPDKPRAVVAAEPTPLQDGIEIALKNNQFKFVQATSEADLRAWARRLAADTGIVMRLPTALPLGVEYPATGGVSRGAKNTVDINFSFKGGLKIHQYREAKSSSEAEKRLLRRKAGEMITIQGHPGKYYRAGELRHIPANSVMWWDGSALLTVWSPSLDREALIQAAESLQAVRG